MGQSGRFGKPETRCAGKNETDGVVEVDTMSNGDK